MKNIYYLILTFILTGTLTAQTYQNIQIDNSGAPEEPSIYINPKNPSQVVAGANINFYYYSTDGGFTWTKGTLVDNVNGVWGDPAIITDTANNFFYFHLAIAPGYTNYDRVVCTKSTNGGMTWWNPGTYTGVQDPKVEDKVWPCVDWSHGPRGNWVYISWTQFDLYNSYNHSDSSRILFSRSTNGGLNWMTPVRLNNLSGWAVDNDSTMEGAVPAVGPNGELYDAWSGPADIPPTHYGIYFQKSTDGGTTWLSNPIYVCDQPGGWNYNINGIYRANGLPFTCCDVSSGPYRGNIYINWTDSAGPLDHDVRLIKSTNGGLTWSSVKRVNDDPPGKEQFFSWMCVDQSNGYLYFVFYDRRNYSDNISTDVYMARSTDGGETFTNFKVSASPFIPNSGVFFGDYTNVSAVNGHVRPIWARLQSGALSVWTAIVEFPASVQNENNELPKYFSLEQNFPNPFNPSTTIKFSIPDITPPGSYVTLKIYDILGRDVATIVNEKLNPGNYEIKWSAAGGASNYSSGVYFYTLKAGSFTDTKKMIISK